MNLKDNILFLGIADHCENDGDFSYPVGKINLLGLSKISKHFFYPISLKSFSFIFLISSELLENEKSKDIHCSLTKQDGTIPLKFTIQIATIDNISERSHVDDSRQIIPFKNNEDKAWSLLSFSAEETLNAPGKYSIFIGEDEANILLDDIQFQYIKVNPFTLEQMEAIKSNPTLNKKAYIHIGCKKCSTIIKVYTALSRDREFENKGYIWQYDTPDSFNCKCGKILISMKYIKESFHGILLQKEHSLFDNVHAIRKYGHIEISKIINRFMLSLDKEEKEEVYQKYIENHPLLLSKYHAKRIFYKKDILGKFITDFVIYDSMNRLILIEIEKPSTLLFKKDGHARAGLIHAFEQVNDWLDEVRRNYHTILELFNLPKDKVSEIRGVVIAGRTKENELRQLMRFRSNPIYPTIEFLTFDELANSALQISQKLK